MSIQTILFDGVHSWWCVFTSGSGSGGYKDSVTLKSALGVRRDPLLAGQSSFYTLICKQGRSIWQLLALQPFSTSHRGMAHPDKSPPRCHHRPQRLLGRWHQQRTCLTFISVTEVDRCRLLRTLSLYMGLIEQQGYCAAGPSAGWANGRTHPVLRRAVGPSQESQGTPEVLVPGRSVLPGQLWSSCSADS